MFQLNLVKGTVVGDIKPVDSGCMFYLDQVNIVNDQEQKRRFLVNYRNKDKAGELKTGDRIVLMGTLKGDEGGRPFIREGNDGSVFTVFDIETYRVYREDEDFAFAMLLGNAGSDPDVRYTAESSKLVSSFSFATNEYKPKGNGQFEKSTIWWRASAWENVGERLGNMLKKGMKLFLFGVLNYDPATGGPRLWERDVDGMKVPASNYEMTVYNYKKLEKSEYGQDNVPDPINQSDDVIPF